MTGGIVYSFREGIVAGEPRATLDHSPSLSLVFWEGTSRLEYPIYEPFEDTWGGEGMEIG